MSLFSVVLAATLSQAPATVEPAAPAPTTAELSAVERAAQAAERAAAAAEKTAALAQKMAESTGAVPPAEAKPATTEEKKKDVWAGSVGLSLMSITGNTDAITFSANAAADRTFEVWTLGFRANGAYGQTQGSDTTPPSVVALRALASVRGDRSFGKLVALFALTSLDADHVKSIEWRWQAELGVGLTFVNKKEGDLERMFLRLDIAGRFAHESRYQFFPVQLALAPAQLVAPRAGIVFRYAVNKHIRFSEEAEVVPNVLGPTAGKRVLVNTNTKLAAALTEMVSMNVSFLTSSDSVPAEGKKPLDTSLTVGLEAAF